MRDNMRPKIERAEVAFLNDKYGNTWRNPGNLWSLDRYAKAITKRAWWKKQGGGAIGGVDFSGRSGPNGCHGSRHAQVIWVDGDSSTFLHVLHTMAHYITPYSHGEPSHDVTFVKNYLEMVRRYYTGTIDEELKRQFKKFLVDEGVKTKTVSEATRAKQSAAAIKRLTPSTEQLLATLSDLEDM